MSARDATIRAVEIDDNPPSQDLALERLARGDTAGAIEHLMAQHGAAVLGFCVRILRDRALADDVLQQTFLEAYRDLHRFQHRSSIRSWLFGIASHRCHDALKSRRRREDRVYRDDTGLALVPDPTAGPDDRLERERLVAALEDCLRGLSDEARTAVLLRFQAGMSYEHMAAVLEAKADTLQRRVSRALPGLRTCLEGKGWRGE